MSIINSNQLPLRVQVTDPLQFCFFTKEHTGDKPAIKAGDIVTLTSKPQGMYSWICFHTQDELGSGKPSGIVHLSGIEVINE